jgi:hypothetical protein
VIIYLCVRARARVKMHNLILMTMNIYVLLETDAVYRIEQDHNPKNNNLYICTCTQFVSQQN